MNILSREFNHLDSESLQDLHDLEREGAIFAQFWQEDDQDFRFCRIRLTYREIVDFLDASVAYDEFLGFQETIKNSSSALKRISNHTIQHRVLEYNEWATKIGQKDTRYCYAAFLGEHLESLICGSTPERYEYLSRTYTGDRRFLLTEILEMFPSATRQLASRQGNRPIYAIDEEQDVRDLLYVIIKSIFPDARIEEFARVHAGSSKRVDIVIPAISTLVEVKYVRDKQHAKKIADELKIDIESYHTHPNCNRLFAYIWDPQSYLVDRSNFIKDLRGLRVKGENRFSVEVFIKP